MSCVLTVGVFDVLHFGHFELFRRARALAGDSGKLLVAVQEDEYVYKYKPEARLIYDFATRCAMIRAIRYVDDVISYRDVDIDIPKIDFDIFAIGGDQLHPGFQRAVAWCENHGHKVERLSRTPNISSTMLRKAQVAQTAPPPASSKGQP